MAPERSLHGLGVPVGLLLKEEKKHRMRKRTLRKVNPKYRNLKNDVTSVRPDPRQSRWTEAGAAQEDSSLSTCSVLNAGAVPAHLISSGHLRVSLGVLRRDDQTDVLEAKRPLSKVTRLQVGSVNQF